MVNMVDLLEAVITEPLEKIIEIYQMDKEVLGSKMHLDYEILNKSLEFNRMDVVDYFLKINCRVNRTDGAAKGSNTPLHHAVIMRDIDLVKRILKRNGSVDAKNANGDTPLHLASINQDVDIVDAIFYYLKSFKSELFVNPKNNYGLSHMHIACARNEVQLVKMYLDSGEDVGHAIYKNSHVYAGYTPLHFAVEIGHNCIETIQLLLSRGANSFLEDASSLSAYDHNEEKLIDYSLIQYVLTQDNHEKCLPHFHMACMEGNMDYFERFLEMGVDVNRPLGSNLAFHPGYRPLHCAVISGNSERVQLLLQHKADINLSDGNNMTPLHLALYNEKPNNSHKDDNIVEILFSSLADPCIKKVDSQGLSYFHVAVTRNKVDLVLQYLEHGYSQVNDKVLRNLRNFSNFTPLHFGVMYGCVDVVRLLLEKKADLNCNDDYMYGTPLHMAMAKGDLTMANLLLDYGASSNVKRIDNQRTPLHLLVLNVLKRPYQLITENLFAKEDADIELLIKRMVIMGCDINVQDIDGNTALHMACSKIRIGSGCVKALLRWGANVDIENNNDKTPFEISFLDSYRCNAEDYIVLFNQVQKLQIAGFVVNENNIACCKRLLNEKDKCDPNAEYFTKQHLQQIEVSLNSEIEKLKDTKLHAQTSLFQVIWDDLDTLKSRARTIRLQKILEVLKPMLDEEIFDFTFPFYGTFVRLWYCVARKYAPEPDSEEKPIPVRARRKKNIYRNVSQKTKKSIRIKKEIKNKQEMTNKRENKGAD